MKETDNGSPARSGDTGCRANVTYTKWLLEAIRKIKQQKQRPSVDRICNAVRQIHKVSRESIVAQLELAVQDGCILKVFNKGLCSYKDPESCPPAKGNVLKVTKSTDLLKVIEKSVRELNENGGSTLRNIEKYIRQNHTLELAPGVDFMQQLTLTAKRAINKNHLVQEGRLFRLPRETGGRGTGNSGQADATDPSAGSNGHVPQLEERPHNVRSQQSKVGLIIHHLLRIHFNTG